MATWVKLPDNSYVQIACIQQAFVQQSTADLSTNTWGIYGHTIAGDSLELKSGFATQAVAQTALDNAIVNLGGSV